MVEVKISTFLCLHILFLILTPGYVSSNPIQIPIEFNDQTLVQVQIIARHGVRAPDFSYPNDIYSDELKYWPNGWGQLTHLGKESQFKLGKFLRRRYGAFLNAKNYHSNDVQALCSFFDRTILSAQLALAGFYTEDIEEKLTLKSLVPVHSISKSIDMIINPTPKCDKRSLLIEKVMNNNSNFLEHMQENRDFYNNLRTKMGYSHGKKDLFGLLNSILSLHIQKIHNLTIPDWGEDAIKPESFKIAAFLLRLTTFTDELKTLTSGPLLAEMLSRMNDKINGSETRKLIYYSGHDITIANFLNALDAYNDNWPDFSSCILIELHKVQDEYFIRSFYKKSRDSEELTPVLTPYCSEFENYCSLSDFEKNIQKFLPKNILDECRVENEEVNESLTFLNSSILSTLDIVLICAVIGLVIILILLTYQNLKSKVKSEAL